MAGEWDISIDPGADWAAQLTWGSGSTADDVVPIDLTGAVVTLRISGSFSKELEVVGGKIQLKLTGAETAMFTAPTGYLVQAVMADGAVAHVLEGLLIPSSHGGAQGGYGYAGPGIGGGYVHYNAVDGPYPSAVGRPLDLPGGPV